MIQGLVWRDDLRVNVPKFFKETFVKHMGSEGIGRWISVTKCIKGQHVLFKDSNSVFKVGFT
jgi:hypothetical protein